MVDVVCRGAPPSSKDPAKDGLGGTTLTLQASSDEEQIIPRTVGFALIVIIEKSLTRQEVL